MLNKTRRFRIFLISLAFILSQGNIYSQVVIGSGEPPSPGALLQLKNIRNVTNGEANATKGLIMPRVTLSKKTELYPMFLSDPENPSSGPNDNYEENKNTIDTIHTGLVVFNITENIEEVLCKGLNFWDGKKWNCLNESTVYTMDCNSVQVNGVYIVDQALDGNTHNISIDIIAESQAIGQVYHIKTDMIDGIYFEGKGKITSSTQTVVLQGKGTPTSSQTKYFSILSNSIKSNATCHATVVMSISTKSIFALGYYENTAGYLGQPNSGLRKMMDASVNFGTNEDSKIKIEKYSDTQTFYPYTILKETNAYNTSRIKEVLDTKPDIVLTGFDLDLLDKATLATYLVDYLKLNGVLIFICERQTMIEAFFNALHPGYTTTADWTTTNPMSLNNINDEILNGPFGDIRTMLWGNDTNGASGVRGIPESDWIIYSRNNNNTPMIMRHKSYNLFFIGEGGFNANYNGGTGSIGGVVDGNSISYPFAIDSSFEPITRTEWTGGNSVENSRLMANILAWALYQAEVNGINTEK